MLCKINYLSCRRWKMLRKKKEKKVNWKSVTLQFSSTMLNISDKPPADKSFSEKLTAQIVNNLQIKISNVHIRYEDKNSADTPFCVGVTLHGLNIYTTDSNWIESYMTEQLSKVFKVMCDFLN